MRLVAQSTVYYEIVSLSRGVFDERNSGAKICDMIIDVTLRCEYARTRTTIVNRQEFSMGGGHRRNSLMNTVRRISDENRSLRRR